MNNSDQINPIEPRALFSSNRQAKAGVSEVVAPSRSRKARIACWFLAVPSLAGAAALLQLSLNGPDSTTRMFLGGFAAVALLFAMFAIVSALERTRITQTEIIWGKLWKKRLRLADVREFSKIVSYGDGPVVVVERQDGRRVQILAGSPELAERFEQLAKELAQVRFKAAAVSVPIDDKGYWVRGEGSLSLAEYDEMMKLIGTNRAAVWALPVMAIAFAVLGSVGESRLGWCVAIGCGVLAVLVAYFRYLNRRALMTAFREKSGVFIHRTILVSPEGIYIATATEAISLLWTGFKRYRVSQNVAALYIEPWFHFISRSLFKTEGEWHTFLAIVAEKVPLQQEETR